MPHFHTWNWSICNMVTNGDVTAVCCGIISTWCLTATQLCHLSTHRITYYFHFRRVNGLIKGDQTRRRENTEKTREKLRVLSYLDCFSLFWRTKKPSPDSRQSISRLFCYSCCVGWFLTVNEPLQGPNGIEPRSPLLGNLSSGNKGETPPCFRTSLIESGLKTPKTCSNGCLYPLKVWHLSSS